jgi:CheY-like chemotaxis protein
MNESVMVVDDDASVRFTAKTVLNANGLRAISVPSGEECLEELRNGFRGLIFMDAAMPDMTGWETIRAMRHEGLLAGNTICMLTAVDAPGPQLRSLRGCVCDYLIKPFDPAELAHVASRCAASLAA